MATNPLRELEARGQSVWQDNITRGQIRSGELKRLIDEDGVSGVTSNPTIFQKAMAGSSDYDDSIRRLVREGKDTPQIVDALIIADIQAGADVFRPVWEKSSHTDGFVSIEVAPNLARDTRGTIDEAHRLWEAVGRPNTMIKIPGTEQGLTAIRDCLADGINVNITLLFSTSRYEQVIQAFFDGIESRLVRGDDVSHVASVASFFVSRVDTIVDKAIEARLKSGGDGVDRAKLQSLIGQAAIANAKLAYKLFQSAFNPTNARWDKLATAGAQGQRPLWASTSMKNPQRRDTLYVEDLIGPRTVNTMPPQTIEAFRDHGVVRGDTVLEGVDEARKVIDSLVAYGVDFDALMDQLEDEGIKLFVDSYDQLVDGVRQKVEAIRAEQPVGRS